MFDILFICKHCGTHLSADENDVGISLPCPDCANEITIPAGDILFQCRWCDKSLLAGRTSARQQFHCPSCSREITVPAIGKLIPVSEKSGPILDPLPPLITPTLNPNPVPVTPPAASEASETAENRQFMSTWGDYLAEAGLAAENPPQNTSPSPPKP